MVRPVSADFIGSRSLKSFFSTPIANIAKITTAVIGIFRKFFLPPQPKALLAPPDAEAFSREFFVHCDPRSTIEKSSFVGTPADMIACMGRPGFLSSPKQISLADGSIVGVSKVFIKDLGRTNDTTQRLVINGEVISGAKEDEGQAKVIQRLYDLLGKNKEKLLEVTEKASQNASISVRDQISRNYNPGAGEIIRFNSDQTAVVTYIQVDPATQRAVIRCELTGSFFELEKLGFMNEERLVRKLPEPVHYRGVGTYDLGESTIDYTVST